MNQPIAEDHAGKHLHRHIQSAVALVAGETTQVPSTAYHWKRSHGRYRSAPDAGDGTARRSTPRQSHLYTGLNAALRGGIVR
jgi:hypothetical protein